MSETVKLIIEIPKEDIELIRKTSFVEDETTMYKQSLADRQGTMMLFRLMDSVKDGTLLDSNNSDRAEVQAYFVGQAHGWEEGRKDLCDKISAEIKDHIVAYDSWTTQRECTATEASTMREALALVEKYKIEAEGKEVDG